MPVASLPASMRVASLVLLGLIAAFPAPALNPLKTVSQYGLESWQAKQGLANGGILCITQSADGYLWLGTRRGLVRFNGVEFQLFDRQTSSGLIGWNVYHIEARRDGSLLFSTEGGTGLIELRNGKFSTFATPPLPNRNVRIFHEGRDGTIWIGTNGPGLTRIKDGTVKTYGAADGVGTNIKAILESRDGSLWIGTYGDGVIHLAGDRITRLGTQQGLPSNDVRAILEDPDGTLWFSTLGGLVRSHAGNLTTFTRRDGLSQDRVFPLCRDRNGNLWIGTEGGGLNRMTDGRFSNLTTQEGAASDEIRSLFEDREGNLWFGTADGGLFRLKDEKYTVYTHREGLSSDLVRAVFEDRERNIWLGTAEGVNVLRGSVITHPREPWMAGTVTSLIQDRSGGIWIGTLGQGLRWAQNGQTKVFLPNRRITALFEDREGSIWAGVLPGLVRIRNGQAESSGVDDAMAKGRIVAIRQDAEGALWTAVESGIVYRILGTEVKEYSLLEGGSPAAITSLHLDQQGELWVGTTEGLCRLQRGAFQCYSVGDGLAEYQVSSILEDDHGFLWLSGFRGFSRIAKSSISQYRRGASSPLPVWFIEHPNGEATSSGHQTPSAWKGSDGRLWFGSLHGLIGIDPSGARPDPSPVPVAIEELLVDRRPVSLPGSPEGARRLPAGVRDIEFRFVGLSLGDPAGVRFKYLLEGYDTDWTDAGNRRVAFYTNLPGRAYRFRVMAANGDGVWNESPATLTFVKDPHLYETWWMRLFLAVAVCGVTWLAYRTRVAGLRKSFAAVLAERNRIARELHDTVEQGLTGVMLQLDTVAAHWNSTPEVARRGLDLARHMARHCMGEARSAVRDLRSENLHAGDAVEALRQMALDLASTGAPEIHLEVQGDPYQLPRDVEMTLMRIGQESLTNAVKHSHATRIDLEVQFAAHNVGLRVTDDGVGFSSEASLLSAASGHFGLLGMRERANKVGGKLVIQSSRGGGTTVDFRVTQTASAGKNPSREEA